MEGLTHFIFVPVFLEHRNYCCSTIIAADQSRLSNVVHKPNQARTENCKEHTVISERSVEIIRMITFQVGHTQQVSILFFNQFSPAEFSHD